MVTKRVARFATAPRTMRRMIDVLSSSVDEPALATTRRTSFPDRGLTMSPIGLLLDKVGGRVGEVSEVHQPRSNIGGRPVGVLPRQRPHLLLATPAAENAEEVERLGFEHQLHGPLANSPRMRSGGELQRPGRPLCEQVLSQYLGQRRQTRLNGIGLSVSDFAERVADVVLVRAHVIEELATSRLLDEPFDAGGEPFVDELFDWAILAVGDVSVDPRLRVAARHPTGAEVRGDSGHVGDRVADSPFGARGHPHGCGGISQWRHMIDDATTSCLVVRDQIQLCHDRGH